MGIERYDRFENPRDFANEIKKSILNGFFQTGDETWRPVFDVIETAVDFRIKVAVPGIGKDDIEIEIREDVLIVSGERKEEKLSVDEERHIKEILYGKFSRSLRLPLPIEPDNVSAKFKDGIVNIILPKSDSIKPRRIKIEEEE